MNATQAVLVTVTVILGGIGPFIAVYRGAPAYDFDDDEMPEADETDDNDDTTAIPRVTVNPYMY